MEQEWQVANRLVFIDGQKAIPIDEKYDYLWTDLSADAAERTKGAMLFGSVPWLHRGVDLRAGAVASMPFAIMRGKTDMDSSDEWENKVGFLPNPVNLLWLIEASLTMANRAYLYRDLLGSRTLDVRYITPTGVKPKFDRTHGLVGFERAVVGIPKMFPPEAFVYFWKPDPYKEIGPSDNSPAQAAAAAAGVLMNVDAFAAAFFGRGAIKATILSVPGSMSKEERDRLKSWWDGLVGGIRNAWKAAVVNADEVKPTIVGEGIESLKNTELTREKREDISTALGIPQTLLFSDAATNATAGEDQLHFLKHTIVPECEFIQSILNEQVFEPMGMRFEFRPETMSEFQEDETKRSTALQQLTSAGLDLIVALEVLGYELTDEQWATLKAKQEADAAANEARMAALAKADAAQVAPTGSQDAPGQDSGTDRTNMPSKGDPRLLGELAAWERFAVRRLGTKARPFSSEFIPTEQVGRIATALLECKSADDVHGVFVHEREKPDLSQLTAALIEVAAALKQDG